MLAKDRARLASNLSVRNFPAKKSLVTLSMYGDSKEFWHRSFQRPNCHLARHPAFDDRLLHSQILHAVAIGSDLLYDSSNPFAPPFTGELPVLLFTSFCLQFRAGDHWRVSYCKIPQKWNHSLRVGGMFKSLRQVRFKASTIRNNRFCWRAILK